MRQAACYGFGVLALFGGEEFARKLQTRLVYRCIFDLHISKFCSETCASVIPSLLKIITDPEARNEDNEVATENAISAVAKILKYNSSHINVDDVLPHW